jgi:hypothetical protein
MQVAAPQLSSALQSSPMQNWAALAIPMVSKHKRARIVESAAVIVDIRVWVESRKKREGSHQPGLEPEAFQLTAGRSNHLELQMLVKLGHIKSKHPRGVRCLVFLL